MYQKLIQYLFLFLIVFTFITCSLGGNIDAWREIINDTNRGGDTEQPPISDEGGVNFTVVIFDTDGGIPQPQNFNVLWDSLIPRIRAVSRAGYGFTGWYDESGNLWDLNTRPVTRNDGSNGIIRLTARWTLSFYTVTFGPNFSVLASTPQRNIGGDIVIDPQLVIPGGKVVEPPVIPTGDGHGLVGWYTLLGTYSGMDEGHNDAGWGHKWDFATDTVAENITLYARWSQYSRTVHLQVNGGLRPDNVQELTRVNFTIFTGLNGVTGGKIIDPGPLSRIGYTFAGWYTDPDFTHEWHFTDKLYEVDIMVGGIMRYDPFTLYAKWIPNIYYVTFDAVGGIPVPATQEITYGERVAQPPAMTKDGMALVGWYKDPLFSAPWNFDTDVVRSNMALYAKWEPIVYTVRFHLGEPNGSPPNAVFITPPEQYVTGKVIEPFMPALPAGNTPDWSFCGWYRSLSPATLPGSINSGALSTAQRDTYLGITPVTAQYDFSSPINPAHTVAEGPAQVLNLYARWVPPDPEMVWVPRGIFTMGDSGVSGSPAILHAYPTRRVTVDGFYINKTEVTQLEYKTLAGSATLNPGITVDPSNTKGDTNPVERVSWFDAVRYCILLTTSKGLTQVYSMVNDLTLTSALIPPTTNLFSINRATVNPPTWTATGYRLPTEAEWEFAARGGHESPGSFIYSGSDDANAVAWFNTNSSGKTHPVGEKTPNALGIFDMSGNVSEWCWDSLETYKGRSNPDLNPVAYVYAASPYSGTERIRRGGAWSNTMANVRNVVRNSDTPDTAHWAIGLRVVRGPNVIW